MLETAAPVECIETRSTSIAIGRAMVDEIIFETSIAVWDHGRRTFRANLRVADNVTELNANRARDAADKFRRLAATLDTLADDVDRLAELEADTIALLDGRARTVTV